MLFKSTNELQKKMDMDWSHSSEDTNKDNENEL